MLRLYGSVKRVLVQPTSNFEPKNVNNFQFFPVGFAGKYLLFGALFGRVSEHKNWPHIDTSSSQNIARIARIAKIDLRSQKLQWSWLSSRSGSENGNI